MRFCTPKALAMLCAAIQPALAHSATPEAVECPAQYLVATTERNANGETLSSMQVMVLSGAAVSLSSGQEFEYTTSIQTAYDKAGKPQPPDVEKDRVLIGTSVTVRVERGSDANDHVWAQIDKTILNDYREFAGGPLNGMGLPSFTIQAAEHQFPLDSGAGAAEIPLGDGAMTIAVRPARATPSEAPCLETAPESAL